MQPAFITVCSFSYLNEESTNTPTDIEPWQPLVVCQPIANADKSPSVAKSNNNMAS
jgi:hypothetical protein